MQKLHENQILRRIIELERELEPDNLGYRWDEIPAQPSTLNKMVLEGVLKVNFKSHSSTNYRLNIPIEEAEKLLEPEMEEQVAEGPVNIPDDLFDVVVGYDSIKRLMLRGLKSGRPVHFLLWGAPATAKSLVLDCIRILPNSTLVLGSSLTKIGIRDVLMDNPRREVVLCLDEIEKVDNPRDLDILLRILQTGEIVKTIHGTHKEMRKKVWAVATANRIDRLSPELRSRFAVFRFREYTDEEFIEVSRRILTRFEGASEETATYIAGKVLRELESRDVRDCVKVIRLNGESRERIDEVIRTIKKYR